MTLKYLICAAAAMVSGVATVAAQSELDGVYVVNTGENSALYSALASGKIVHDEETVRDLIRHGLKDGRVNSQEMDAFRELAREDVSHVTLNLNGQTYKVPVAESAGRELLNLASEVKVNLNALWDQGVPGRRKVYLYHGLSLSHKNHIQRFVASKLQPAWKQSNINNAYMPLRQEIGRLHKQNETELADMHEEACDILHDAAKTLDQYLKDAVPDYTYSWLPSHIKN